MASDLTIAHHTIVTISIAYRLLLAEIYLTWAECIAKASELAPEIDLERWDEYPLREQLRREVDRLAGPFLPLVVGEERTAA